MITKAEFQKLLERAAAMKRQPAFSLTDASLSGPEFSNKKRRISMFIRSDKIRIQHIYEALSISGDIHIDDGGIRRFTPRNYEYGFEFCCESYDGKRSRGFGKPGRAASWTDYGRFIAHLYKIDPQARIGHYKNATDYIKLTSDDSARNGEPAPWLNDRDLMQYA